MLILSDDFAEKDLIGHQDYCDGLVEMIRDVESSGSFTIGIYGQWGSGKTSMLKQIKKALDESSSEDPAVVTVWFNPWQFVAEEHLIIPFFHTLIAALETSAKKSEREKVVFSQKLSGFVKKIAHVPLALVYGMETKVKIPFLLETKFCFDKIMDRQKEKEDEINAAAAPQKEAAMQAVAKDYESTYYNLHRILQDAAADLGVKIVVFIDDLDRCLPEKAVQLLEGLKVLMDLKNFVFVMGVAQEVIERGIRVRYRDLYSAGPQEDLPNIEGQYLDKIIQFPFSLPAADPDHLKKNILAEQLGKLKVAEPFIEMVQEALGNNPRTVKRFINAVSFAMHIAEKKSVENNDFHPELLIKTCLIGYLFPLLYRQLERYPSHLVTLEKIIRESEEERAKKSSGSEGGFIEGQGPQVKQFGLAIIDRWLEEDKLGKLRPILRSRPGETGFNNAKTVDKYVRLLAISLQSEVTSKTRDSETVNVSLRDQMKKRMVDIEGGTFSMGDDETGCMQVTLSPFKMDKFPVTQALYAQVMNKNPSGFQGEDRPVEKVSWFDAVEFCNALSEQCGLDKAYEIDGEKVKPIPVANGYRLPTESEWEYACRAGTTDSRYADLAEIAWYDENSGGETHGVGQKQANGFGLYDMLGNVLEWCNDWYEKKYPSGAVVDPAGPKTGSRRVLRGGGWFNSAGGCRSAYRLNGAPGARSGDCGFRLARGQKETGKGERAL